MRGSIAFTIHEVIFTLRECNSVTVRAMKPFIELDDDVEIDPEVPPAPIDPDTANLPGKDSAVRAEERYRHLLPFGTTISTDWSDEWVKKVIKAEEAQGYAICGARRSTADMSLEEIQAADPITLVCKRRAGWGTDVSEGRCKDHGGGGHLAKGQTGQTSILKHRRLSERVNAFYEDDKLMDIRSAVATIWAAADAMLEGDDEITPSRAVEIAGMMQKIANMTKQYEDIQERRRISIGVPEFMQWADYFYELAVRHIQEAGGDPALFLRDAQQFYDRTVTIVVGADAGRVRLGEGGPVGALPIEGVSRP